MTSAEVHYVLPRYMPTFITRSFVRELFSSVRSPIVSGNKVYEAQPRYLGFGINKVYLIEDKIIDATDNFIKQV